MKKRIIRVLVYEGDDNWLNHVLNRSWIQPSRPFIIADKSIKEIKRIEIILDEKEKNE